MNADLPEPDSACIAETVQIGKDPNTFELRCQAHGHVCTYSEIEVRQFGEKDLQSRINIAWAKHVASTEFPPQVPPETLQQLAIKWMEMFQQCARAEDRHNVIQLFDKDALLAGTQKGGALDSILSKNFRFEADAAKMIPHGANILFLAPWHAVSMVHGGPTRKGDATFYAGLQIRTDGKKEFRCYHAHFSEIQ